MMSEARHTLKQKNRVQAFFLTSLGCLFSAVFSDTAKLRFAPLLAVALHYERGIDLI